ncbi:MAG: hypothetical protein CVU35_03590 [Betaproteobacteria bacterium HGW-Betaproteobacteria-8]|nr:MAG: hypothetical protein CVU35_03590 [Betaproteobacteria bacterium HGW-Betaproteobacteria-8]
MDIKHIIEPERMGLWVAVTFILALIALILSFISLNRSNDLMYMTQTQVLLLNKKIEDAKVPSAEPAAVEPAAEQME